MLKPEQNTLDLETFLITSICFCLLLLFFLLVYQQEYEIPFSERVIAKLLEKQGFKEIVIDETISFNICDIPNRQITKNTEALTSKATSGRRFWAKNFNNQEVFGYVCPDSPNVRIE